MLLTSWLDGHTRTDGLGKGATPRWVVTLVVTAPLLSPHKGNKTGFDFFFSLVTRAHLEHPLGFILDLQFGFGIGHLVDLVPDRSLAAFLLLSLVISLNKFKLVLFSSRGTVLYLLLYKSALVPSTSFTLSLTHTILT